MHAKIKKWLEISKTLCTYKERLALEMWFFKESLNDLEDDDFEMINKIGDKHIPQGRQLEYGQLGRPKSNVFPPFYSKTRIYTIRYQYDGSITIDTMPIPNKDKMLATANLRKEFLCNYLDVESYESYVGRIKNNIKIIRKQAHESIRSQKTKIENARAHIKRQEKIEELILNNEA